MVRNTTYSRRELVRLNRRFAGGKPTTIPTRRAREVMQKQVKIGRKKVDLMLSKDDAHELAEMSQQNQGHVGMGVNSPLEYASLNKFLFLDYAYEPFIDDEDPVFSDADYHYDLVTDNGHHRHHEYCN